jgi:hypothetical protein
MYSALHAQIDQCIYEYPRLSGKLGTIKSEIRSAAHHGKNQVFITMDFLAESEEELSIVCYVLEKLGFQIAVREDEILEIFW